MKQQMIGLTGPTGSGKGEVARVLAALGCAIVDADRTARVVTTEAECLQALADAFGADVLNEDGSLNRKLLARRAFESKEREEQLNAITHPRILQRMKEDAQTALQAGAPAVVFDAPLLFESGLDQMCGTVVAVTADPAIRLQRICVRDSISEEDARLRINIQPTDSFYTARADSVFFNNGTAEELREAVVQWFHNDWCKGGESTR